jgi:hypothetical protein
LKPEKRQFSPPTSIALLPSATNVTPPGGSTPTGSGSISCAFVSPAGTTIRNADIQIEDSFLFRFLMAILL